MFLLEKHLSFGRGAFFLRLRTCKLFPVKRILAQIAGLSFLYLLLSCVIHYWILPEARPNPSDFPRKGGTIFNPIAKERVTFLSGRLENQNRFFEIKKKQRVEIDIDNIVYGGNGISKQNYQNYEKYG